MIYVKPCWLSDGQQATLEEEFVLILDMPVTGTEMEIKDKTMKTFIRHQYEISCFNNSFLSSAVHDVFLPLLIAGMFFGAFTSQADAQYAVLLNQPVNSVYYTGVFNTNMTVTDTHELWGVGTVVNINSVGQPVYANFYLGYEGTLNGSIQVELQQWDGINTTIAGTATVTPSSGAVALYDVHLTNAGGDCTIKAGNQYWLHIYSSVSVDRLTSYGGEPYYDTNIPPLFLNNIYQVVTAETQQVLVPFIAVQPANQNISVGSNAVFGVAAYGQPLNYQWQFNGQNITSAANADLSLTNVKFSDAGGYSVIVNNTYGSVTSAVAYLTVFTNLVLTQTNRVPTTNEIGKPTIPTDPNYFKVWTNGSFQSGIAMDPSKSTVVLTHGWNDSPYTWPAYTAQIIQKRIGSNAVNIVAWDWSSDAASPWYDLGKIARKTPGEGEALGKDLITTLGANYFQKIHFIGHSLGTLVNAAAANYLETNGYSWANIQMTLCDEAEVAWGFTSAGWQMATTLPNVQQGVSTLATLAGNFSTPQPYWENPLPAHFAWADNYISAFGLLHTNTANIVLTYEYPSSFPDVSTVVQEFYNFHDYAHYFYEDTIEPSIYNTGGETNATYTGFVCSFEGGNFVGRPAANTYFYQDPNGLELNLVQTNLEFATNCLNARFTNYLRIGASSIDWQGIDGIVNGIGQAVGQVNGQIESSGQNLRNMVLKFFTSATSGPLVQTSGARPMEGPNGTSSDNTPAYAWISLNVPPNADSMSFDFMLQGDGNNDSFQVALNGTNVLSLETSLIQTNVTLNSGSINVSQYAGQQVSLFLGIAGGTSTNAALTVSDFQFYVPLPPSLRATRSGHILILSWPLSANGYALETTTNLTAPDSWTLVTNTPAIADFQYVVTNQISVPSRYYRLN